MDPHRSGGELGVRSSCLLSEAEVGARALAVQVDEEPRGLASADVKHARSLRPQLLEFQSAPLAAPAGTDEHEHALVVELAVLLRLRAVVLPGAGKVIRYEMFFERNPALAAAGLSADAHTSSRTVSGPACCIAREKQKSGRLC